MSDTGGATSTDPGRSAAPPLECDVVMKGGITSGVVYPGALVTLARTYRLRGLGGASAGAIGAAAGAAAEHGRASGGFDRLADLPDQLGEGRLRALFQARRDTRPMLRLMLAATSSGSKAVKVLWALLRSFPLAVLLGAAPGVAAIVFGATRSGAERVVIVVLGALVALVGITVLLASRVAWVLTQKVTANNFGICTGLGVDPADGPGFTDWLAEQLDALAGRSGADGPLTFGQLWTGTDEARPTPPGERVVDLRMVTTCLSESQPFEMPWAQGRYYFDADEWRQLFPGPVVDHLVAHERAGDAEENQRLLAHDPPLTRMPMPEHLPVIVATRMSLSFPLLISAIPMWTIDRRSDEPVKVWFTDGGLCNNFPVQMFDAALPTRPTFMINLGRFADDGDQRPDEVENIRYARTNRSGIAPRLAVIPCTGRKAVSGFAGQALNSARNWSDVSQLDQPGYRDRIVEVLQTKEQGGMNLDMGTEAIDRLAARGEAAATAMVAQFNEPRYRERFTGWDNHRWVRYRAALAALPAFVDSFRQGSALLGIDPADPPSYDVRRDEADLAAEVQARLVDLADAIASTDRDTVDGLVHDPRPHTVLRRVPQL